MLDQLRPPADLAEARARLRAAATAEAGDGPIAHVADLGAGGEPTLEAAVLVADCVLWRADDAAVDRLVAAVEARAVLLFLEPTAELGWRRLVQWLATPLWLRLVGHHFGSDVPARLRATGLLVTDVDRFELGLGGVRSYVAGRARARARGGARGESDPLSPR